MLIRKTYKIEKETNEGWMPVRMNLDDKTIVTEFDLLVADQPKSRFRGVVVQESIVLDSANPK